MFHAEPWSAAFINVLGKNADEGLAGLKALATPLKPVSGRLLNPHAAKWLEKMLRESINDSGLSNSVAESSVAEYVLRFICLLADKKMFRRVDSLIEKIEKQLDEQNNVLELTAESAAPMDGAFEEELKKSIARRTGSAGIKMKVTVAPELIAGFRLRSGGFFIDASLKGQLEIMLADISGAIP
jgi:ATP synthase F1 delta subunit